MAITIKDIAEYAGVSTATVSLALRGRGSVSERTRRKIRRLAADLGYQPSGLGRALQSGRSRLLGYLLPFVSGSYFNEVLQGAGHEAATRGYGLLAAITGGSEKETRDQLRIFREKRIDGLLVSADSAKLLPTILEFERHGCPVVFCSMSSPLPDLPSSVTDNLLGSRLAAEHLIQQGARRPAYFTLSGQRDQRYEGFSAFLAARPGFGPAPFLADAKALARALKKDRPDAIFAYCDDMAVAAKEIIEQAGLSIPDDLLLMGFDNAPFAAYPGYRLTSVEPQKRRIGEEAVRLLLDRMAGRPAAPVRLVPEIVPRDSTARRG